MFVKTFEAVSVPGITNEQRGFLQAFSTRAASLRQTLGLIPAYPDALNYWCERGDSNPHPLRDQILSLDPATDSEPLQQVTSANSEQVRQNPQPSRKSISSGNAPPIEETRKGREE